MRMRIIKKEQDGNEMSKKCECEQLKKNRLRMK